MQSNYTHISNYNQYGVTVDSTQLYFLTVISPKNKQIKLGYQDPHITIEKLIKQYQQLTTEQIKYRIHFRFIQQGPLNSTIALYEDQLSSLSLNYDDYCFRAEDLSFQQQILELTKAEQIRQKKISKKFIEVIARYHPEQVIMKVDLQKSLSDFKEQIIEKFKGLKDVNPVNIKINCKGLFINEKILKMSEAKLENKSQINIIVKKQNGCFSKNSQILLQNNRQCNISEIKSGQKIISYNHEKKIFQVDEVTSIIKCNLDFCVLLKFEDGTSIETTINHPFLCQDKKYRKIQKQAESSDQLQVGSLVCRKDGRSVKLIAIQQQYYSSSQQFFHLCVAKNHNFIVNGIVAHNPTVKVQLPNQQIQIVNINPTQPLEAIKKHIQRQYGINSHNIQLIFAGKIIKDSETMADKNIGKDATIYLIYIPSSQFNFIEQSMDILLNNQKIVPIKQLNQKTQIAAYDWNSNSLAYMGEIPKIVDSKKKQWMTICLDSFENKIIVSPETFMQIQDGQVICARDLCYKYKRDYWPQLRKVNGDLIQIKQIAHYCDSIKFFKRIQLLQLQSYSINGVIIHNKFVNILFKRNNQQDIKLSFPIIQSFKVFKLKSMVSQTLQIDIKNIAFTFEDKILEDDQYLFSYANFGPQNIIVANSIKSVKDSKLISNYKPVNREDIKVILQVSRTQTYPIQYIDYQNKKIQQIMNKYYPKCKGSYFFAYGDILMTPTDFLNKIEESQYFQIGDKNILVVINQKLAFVHNMDIKGSQIQNHSQILIKQKKKEGVNLAASRILVHHDPKYSKEFADALQRVSNNKNISYKYRSQQFCKPFLYLTSQQYNKRIFERIRYFQRHDSQLSEEKSVYSIIKDLYINQHMLKSYNGLCYIGVNNFRFSFFYGKNDTFYWYSFMIAYKSIDKVQSQVSKNRGTVFVITSLNGKEISDFSLYPQHQEILFAPFTYFIVEKIQIQQDFDRVFLSQISSPISFQKNIVLWVDDVPKNNIDLINQILSQLDIQILQVTSTVQALKWVKQFGWLLNWKGIKFKLISDMSRIQQEKQNHVAGVDLLEQLYKQDVITTSQTLIFCGDVERARKNISDRQIWKNQYFYVCATNQQLIKFVSKDFKQK